LLDFFARFFGFLDGVDEDVVVAGVTPAIMVVLYICRILFTLHCNVIGTRRSASYLLR
jgi:hypothetical protein